SRYYDAQSGRFISMDSYRGEIGNPLSLNLYGYCEGNPIKYTDRAGTWPKFINKIVKFAKKSLFKPVRYTRSNLPKTIKQSKTVKIKKTKIAKWFKKTAKEEKRKWNLNKKKTREATKKAKKRHYDRIRIQEEFNKNYPGGEAQMILDAEAGERGWEAADDSENLYHRNIFLPQGKSALKNKKYLKVNEDGSSYEIIIGEKDDGKHFIVKDPVNGGTYNYSDKKSTFLSYGHFFEDMVPYYKWGNTTDPIEKYYRNRRIKYYSNRVRRNTLRYGGLI
ncbi:MAG TPA: hypothetical protein GX736_03645, partial [Mogibacterium sp.]|nr:hypothetical protein [Mogibacterium sp.]